MYIEELTLTNYRNYNKLTVSFDQKINVIIGENAQGKTNLMESVYVLAFTKSHRTPRDKELIKWDAEYGKIEGRVFKRNQSIPLEVVLSNKGKKVKFNHIEQKRLSEYVGSMNIVMFAPEDLNLVKGSPQERRKFIDMEIGQTQPVYIHHLTQYQRILKERNALLKDLQRQFITDSTMLHVYTEQLIEHASIILERRFLFLNKLRKWANPIHEGISQGKELLNIDYNASVNVSEAMNSEKIRMVYEQHFKNIENKEIDRGTTLIGPHRDDLVFTVNDKNVQTYGSQGQQRTTALSLKLAEIELIYEEVGEYPILLLDDVLSELDDHRQSHLLNTIQGKVQTFVTTTSIDGIAHDTISQAEIFTIHDGQLVEER
ncbi:DNA replication/repair protein RecF [Tenuibacillus multivorans]|uniref:DNA replication and repair protein RecF n=1 Tax=Tenuibacillus multivorans TaxID=237069 RepID=A0A1G9W6S9_9BACI|nr:DNA replication/repair protein RecF [Tenuibacillus multivorans]GEL76319.1 DNA replication and repair protein RecF [Tenuibacillus multivorans]SDM79735.1 DNA replication and repair protein RecF [Tenuibacillus multivorans]